MTKSKYWEGILYPENMVQGWEDIIDSALEFPYAYCLHDKDLLKDTEENRKPHIHCIIAYSSNTTGKHIQKLFNRLSIEGKICCPRVEDKYNIRGAYNYLIHDTDKAREQGKFQYSKECRIEGNNFDIGLYEQLTLSEKDEMCDELCRYILQEQITNYADFYIKVLEEFDKSYIRIIKTYSGHLERLIKGVYNKKRSGRNDQLINEIERKDQIIEAQKEYIERLKLGK